MTTRLFGERVQRLEDERLLRGQGRYTDDLGNGALECAFVRSPFAHARIHSPSTPPPTCPSATWTSRS